MNAEVSQTNRREQEGGDVHITSLSKAGALVKRLKLPAWKVGDRGLEPYSGIKVSKKFFPRSPVNVEYHGEFP